MTWSANSRPPDAPTVSTARTPVDLEQPVVLFLLTDDAEGGRGLRRARLEVTEQLDTYISVAQLPERAAHACQARLQIVQNVRPLATDRQRQRFAQAARGETSASSSRWQVGSCNHEAGRSGSTALQM